MYTYVYADHANMSQYLYLLVKVRTREIYFSIPAGHLDVAIPIPSGEGQNWKELTLCILTSMVAIPIPSGEGQNITRNGAHTSLTLVAIPIPSGEGQNGSDQRCGAP